MDELKYLSGHANNQISEYLISLHVDQFSARLSVAISWEFSILFQFEHFWSTWVDTLHLRHQSYKKQISKKSAAVQISKQKVNMVLLFNKDFVLSEQMHN